MEKSVVIYQSKYGATQKYAEWLAEELHCEAIDKKKFDAKRLADYDTIIFGGSVYASGIKGLSLIKNNTDKLKAKRVICFAVGAAPDDEANLKGLRQKNMSDDLNKYELFYCRGALNLDKMKGMDKMIMNMFKKMVSKKDPETLEPSEASILTNLDSVEDWTDKKYLEPLIAHIKSNA